MSVHPAAGRPAELSKLVDVPALIASYYTNRPDPSLATQRVSFGTSGHRGTSLAGTFTETHILATTQAICDYRGQQGTAGPLFLGRDTHALSEPAFRSAVEVLAGNDAEVAIDREGGYTPTPAVSHAILRHNRDRAAPRADGIIITPSHNPPADGGFKYNPPHGGPADTEATRWIEQRANELIERELSGVRRLSYERALHAPCTRRFDYIESYVGDLDRVVDFAIIREAGVRIGIDPMGGAGIAYWAPITERFGIDLTVVNDRVEPDFRFMRTDRDGKIRMDCSSPWAMAGLVEMQEQFDIACGNDTDFDRHGIVTPKAGLLNPNHVLAVAVDYLFRHRPGWAPAVGVGKTLVSSSIIDRVATDLDRPLLEVPVGFKWFVPGLLDGSCGFAGEESAGASFLCQDGSPWSTDKDGIILDLLAAEITARTGRDLGDLYSDLTGRFGEPVYERIDAPATPEEKRILAALDAEQVTASELAGDAITAILTRAPGNDAPIGGLKVVTEQGWFAARPSGTEEIYKIYAESFRGRDHLARIQEEARAIVAAALAAR